MKKNTIRRVRLTREQREQVQRDASYLGAWDSRGFRLLQAAMDRRIHVRYLAVSPACLVPYDAATLAWVTANLQEEPTRREVLLRGMLDGTLPALLAYRTDQGDLCSFDDYLLLAVARDASLGTVRVAVLGEGDEWLKTKDTWSVLFDRTGRPVVGVR